MLHPLGSQLHLVAAAVGEKRLGTARIPFPGEDLGLKVEFLGVWGCGLRVRGRKVEGLGSQCLWVLGSRDLGFGTRV